MNFKIFIIIILIFNMLFLSSCWNSRELSTLAILSAFGIDKEIKGNGFILTPQIIIPKNIKQNTSSLSASSGKTQGDPYYNLSIRSNGTTFNAIRQGPHSINYKTFNHHNKILIFGTEIAKDGVMRFVDQFVRDHDSRGNMNIIIAEGMAKDILEVGVPLQPIPGYYITDLIEATGANSESSVIMIGEFLSRIISDTTSAYASLIKATGEKDDKKLYLSGTAVFKKDKYIGKLDGTETRGFLFVINKVKSGIVEFPAPGDNGLIGIENIRAKTDVSAELLNDNKVKVNVNILLEGNVGTQTVPIVDISPENQEYMKEQIKKTVKEEVLNTFKKTQKMNADVYGFGDMIYKKHPKKWEKIKKNWDEIYSNIEMNVQVDPKIKGNGMLIRWDLD